MSKHYIPSGYDVVTPYLCCENADSAIRFYCEALGAKEEQKRWVEPSGKIGHAELSFDGQKIFVSDPYPNFGTVPPTGSRDVSQKLFMYVPHLDDVVNSAVNQGATLLMPIKHEKGLGTRTARIMDPYGHVWVLSTKVVDIAKEDMDLTREKFSKTGEM